MDKIYVLTASSGSPHEGFSTELLFGDLDESRLQSLKIVCESIAVKYKEAERITHEHMGTWRIGRDPVSPAFNAAYMAERERFFGAHLVLTPEEQAIYPKVWHYHDWSFNVEDVDVLD